MNTKRIIAILKQEYFLTLRSMEVIVDIFFFPIVNIVVFGFLSLYLSGTNTIAGEYVIMGMLLWQVIWIVEYSVTVGSLWNIWSRNLSNMFIAPLKLSEYIIAHTISGVAKSFIVLCMGATLSAYVFHFNLLDIGIVPLILVFFNFVVFAFSLGIVILGLLFRFGTRIQALAWGFVTIFQPLSAAFYPLSVLPPVLQTIATIFPATYTFEAARFALQYHEVNVRLFGIAFLENIIWLLVCSALFFWLFNTSRETGQFARNEA
jgi:ABC-2 type transport system permease protein